MIENRWRETGKTRRVVGGFPKAWRGSSGDSRVPVGCWCGQVSRGRVYRGKCVESSPEEEYRVRSNPPRNEVNVQGGSRQTNKHVDKTATARLEAGKPSNSKPKKNKSPAQEKRDKVRLEVWRKTRRVGKRGNQDKPVASPHTPPAVSVDVLPSAEWSQFLMGQTRLKLYFCPDFWSFQDSIEFGIHWCNQLKLGLKRVRNFETGYPICENRTVTG